MGGSSYVMQHANPSSNRDGANQWALARYQMEDVVHMSQERALQGGFFADPDFDYDARLALGATACGLGDAGLVLATIDRIVDGDRQSWFDAWSEVAATMSAEGDKALRQGHLRTARWALLAAAQFYAKALVVVDALPDQSVFMPTFKEHRRCWEAVVDASEGSIVRVEVPYESTKLPGYLLRPDSSGAARPTFIMTNGSDEALPNLLAHGAAEALARGWNAFLFDGPGQQSMLFDQNVPFRYDWEAVLSPVIDTLIERPDVDASALTGYGVSQGGYWVTRAIAFERRLVAAVADPGCVDVSESWTRHLAPPVAEMLESGQKDAFNAAMATGCDPGSDFVASAPRPRNATHRGWPPSCPKTLGDSNDRGHRCPQRHVLPSEHEFDPTAPCVERPGVVVNSSLTQRTNVLEGKGPPRKRRGTMSQCTGRARRTWGTCCLSAVSDGA